MSTEYVEKVYNWYSRFYDLTFGKVVNGGREMVPAMLDLFPGARLLEVGVGTGLSLPYLPRNVEIVGIDLSEKMLEKCRMRIQEHRLNQVRLLKMDAAHLQFPENSFDRVLAAYFISTVPDPVKVIGEMKRVCRPGGCLLFQNHFQYDQPMIRFFENLLSPFFYRLGFRTDLNLHSLMQDCGLKIEALEPTDVLGHWKTVRCVNP